MDGAKAITDTMDDENRSRQAFCQGRSIPTRGYGPFRIENPGESRNRAELESLPPKGQGFLDNANQSRVSRS